MKFKVRPILTEIKELYQQEISVDRFKNYLNKLQGSSKADLILPIAGFNPMAKEHVLQKVSELEELQAEELMLEVVETFNKNLEAKINVKQDDEFLVVLNLADDLKGAWTNRYTTDFDHKFKLNAFVTRKFCTPYFWSSENYTKDLIVSRTKASLCRTLYWVNNSKPITLEDHMKQETFVAEKCELDLRKSEGEPFVEIKKFFSEHKDSEEQDLIFNFFYGDGASESLAYKQYGIKNITGFDLAVKFARDIK